MFSSSGIHEVVVKRVSAWLSASPVEKIIWLNTVYHLPTKCYWEFVALDLEFEKIC